MKKLPVFIFLSFFLLKIDVGNAQIFSARDGEISFFSSTPLENIDAHNKSVNSFINISKKEILFIVPIRSFEFKKKLMQEHFNENYMESDKFPSASFSGVLLGDFDVTKNGVYEVTASGNLKIHGIEKKISEKGKISVTDGTFTLESAFSVLLNDYNIEKPKIVYQNIAERIEIKIKMNYIPYKKK
jgi:hypothetical protein